MATGKIASLGAKANQNQLATVVYGTTASREFLVGEYLFLEGTFYKVITVIPEGGTITPGTNVTPVKLANEIAVQIQANNSKLPRIKSSTRTWEIWDIATSQYVDTGVSIDTEIFVDDTLSQAGYAADAAKVGELKSDLQNNNILLRDLAADVSALNYPINYSDGTVDQGLSATLKHTGYIDVSGCAAIYYARMASTSATVSNVGMAFYRADNSYISGQRRLHDSGQSEYQITKITVPSEAAKARFSLFASIPGFFVYDAEQYEANVNNKIAELQADVRAADDAIDGISSVVKKQTPQLLAWYQGMVDTNGNIDASVAQYGIHSEVVESPVGTKISYTGPEASGDGTAYVAWLCQYKVDGTFARRTVLKNSSNEYSTIITSYPKVMYGLTHLVSTGKSVSVSEGSAFTVSTVLPIEQGTGDSDNVVALLPDVPISEGIQNAILRARQITDIKWTPIADMPGLVKNRSTGDYERYTHHAGTRQTGIPYSRGQAFDRQIGQDISFGAFATAVRNANSVVYTQDVYSATDKRGNYYGIVCSKMVQYAWGAPQVYPSQYIEQMPGLTKIAAPGQWDENDIRLGDGVINPDVHCTICTGILRDTSGVVHEIEISEATTPLARRLRWRIGEFFRHFANYGLYRYEYIDDVQYEKSPFIDLEDGITRTNNPPLMIRRGTDINVPVNASRAVDVDSSVWKVLHDVVNGADTTSQINSDVIYLPTTTIGYHEVYPTKSNGDRGESCFYYVYDGVPTITFSKNGNQLTLHYESDSRADFVQWGDSTNYKINMLDGSGDEVITIPSGQTKFRIAFVTEYGHWYSSFVTVT